MEWHQLGEFELAAETYPKGELHVGGVVFEVAPVSFRQSTPDHFILIKTPAMVDRYVELARRLPARTVVELGIYHGGSAALLAMLPEVEHVVAFELEEGPTEQVLADFARAQGLGDRFRMCFGVDQGDKPTLWQVLAEQGVEEIDLVTDDASHLYEPTIASFEALFPLLRPGGFYVIEDWRAAHVQVGLGPEHAKGLNVPLTTMVFELLMACGTDPEVVARVDTRPDMVVVTRGPAPLDPAGFSLRSLYGDDAAALLGDWRER